MVSGLPFGTASYTVVEGTPLFVDVGAFVALTRAPRSIATVWLLLAKLVSLLLAFLQILEQSHRVLLLARALGHAR